MAVSVFIIFNGFVLWRVRDQRLKDVCWLYLVTWSLAGFAWSLACWLVASGEAVQGNCSISSWPNASVIGQLIHTRHHSSLAFYHLSRMIVCVGKMFHSVQMVAIGGIMVLMRSVFAPMLNSPPLEVLSCSFSVFWLRLPACLSVYLYFTLCVCVCVCVCVLCVCLSVSVCRCACMYVCIYFLLEISI